MRSRRLFKLLMFLVLPITYYLSPITYSYALETLTITTYYPSPYGSYQDLRTVTLTVTGNATVGGTLTAGSISGSISGDGSGLTNLNASNLTSGTVPSARLTGPYTGITGVGTITAGTWNAAAIADGFVADNLTISAGSINNTPIGQTTAAAGNFSALTKSGFTVWDANNDGGGSGLDADLLDGSHLANIGVGFIPAQCTNADTVDLYHAPTGSCAAGSSIRQINANGTVVCESDDVGGAGYWAASGNDIYNTNTGSVGIGTTSPTARLQVETPGGGLFSLAARINNLSTGAFQNGLLIRTASAMWESSALSVITGVISALYVRSDGIVGIGTTSPQAKMNIEQTAAMDAFRVDDEANDTTPFVIDQDGDVGIGTTSPGKKLEVNGTMGFTGGTGPFCIFANACPTGWVDKGLGGYIRENSGSCPYVTGSAFNPSWTWCHPKICCNE